MDVKSETSACNLQKNYPIFLSQSQFPSFYNQEYRPYLSNYGFKYSKPKDTTTENLCHSDNIYDLSSFISIKKESSLLIKEELALKLEDPSSQRSSESECNSPKIESQITKNELIANKMSIFPKILPSNVLPCLNFNMKNELEKLIVIITANTNQNHANIMIARSFYVQHPVLIQIYDKLANKYYSAKKTREDTIRYVIRKAFKNIKVSLIKSERLTDQKATIMLYKKYLKPSLEKNNSLEQIKDKPEYKDDEDEMMKLFMPYRKDSKIKTINSSFLLQIFSSEAFCEEYKKFLVDFDEIMAKENMKKVSDFANFMIECIKKSQLEKIISYNRLPWLEVWVKDTKRVAQDLLKYENQTSWKKNKERI